MHSIENFFSIYVWFYLCIMIFKHICKIILNKEVDSPADGALIIKL